MNKSGKISLIALLTVACGVGGYFAAGAILDSGKGSVANGSGSNGNFAGASPAGNGGINIIENINSGDNTAKTEIICTDINTEVADEPKIKEPASTSGLDSDTVPAITSITKPVYNAGTKKYTFNVVAEGGSGLKYILSSYHGSVLKTQDSGAFTVDPVQNTGKYLVFVTDASGRKSETKTISGCVVVHEKLSAAQIQTAFNSGDYMEGDKLDFKNRISRNCSYSYSNLKEGDEKPSSFNEIFNRIQLSSWKSVSVNSVSYDQASNQVTRISMTINY